MRFRALAFDYDGTLAPAGRIAPETMAALAAVRADGWLVLLVTGRQFDDLLQVCPEIGVFDLIVAENGAVLFDPRTGRVEDLAKPPPDAFLVALADAAVPFSTGRVVVSTVVPHEISVVEAIRALGLELHIIFNRESVMVLPADISKESGLRAAVEALGLSLPDVIAVGDSENDHSFLKCAGLGVAVANAVPAVAATADVVTRAPNGAGVRELIDQLLRDEGVALRRRDDR